jgi:hypothetical protein
MTTLQGNRERIHDVDHVTGWELLGRGAIRKGDTKAVFIPKPKGTERWQLYDLATDPGEVRDLAEEQPDVLKELLALWDQYVLENGVIPLQPELGEYVEALEGQMTVSAIVAYLLRCEPDLGQEQGWMEYEFWHPGGIENPEKFVSEPPRFPSQRPKNPKPTVQVPLAVA